MIGTAIAQALPEMQANAISMMGDTITIVRRAALQDMVPDPVTGAITPTLTTIYSGVARIKPMKRVTDGSVAAGEALDSQSIYIVSVPHSAVGIRPGDVVRTSSSDDPDVVADVLRVQIVEDGALTTAKRLTCELVEARQ